MIRLAIHVAALNALLLAAVTTTAQEEPGVHPVPNEPNHSVVIGKLLRAEAGRLVVQAGAAGEVTLATTAGTQFRLSAPGTTALLKKGMVVRFQGKVDWKDFYNLQDPSLTLQLEPPRQDTKIRVVSLPADERAQGFIHSFEPSLREKDRSWDLRSEVTIELYGTILSTAPLVVQVTSETDKLSFVGAKDDQSGLFPIHGARFTLKMPDDAPISVSLGSAWQLLGENPDVHIRAIKDTSRSSALFKVPGGGPGCWIVTAQREQPLTADELKAPSAGKQKAKPRKPK